MRSFESAPLITIGALFGGAYLLGNHPETLGMGPGIQTIFDETHYIAAHRSYARQLMGVALAIGLIFVLLVALAPPRLRMVGTAATFTACAGIVLSVAPQLFLARQGMPRRYVDYSDAFELWNRMAIAGALITLCAVALLIVLLLIALWRRFSARPA